MARETIASMAVRLGIDMSGFDKDLKEFQKTWGKLGGQLQNAGTKIGMTFTAAGASIAAGLGFAVNKAMEFDSQMSRVGAISGAVGEDLEALRQTALELGASTSKSAGEVAVGMELMAAKGYEASQVIAAMPGVIAAAEASGEDMAMVADTVASALNAFGLSAGDASRVADVLAMSANTSAAGVIDLQYAFKYAAPVANALGISMEQLAAATGIMADSGMKGEQAGTTLRSALLSLADPSKNAKKMLDQLGVAVTDAGGNFLPFDKILGRLSTSTASMTDAQKAQALSTIFGTQAMSGMLSLIEAGPEKFQTLTAGLENSAGASQTAAAAMKDNLGGSMEELYGAIETLQISLGTALAPAIREVADWVAGLVNWFNELSPETQRFITIGAALTAGLLTLIGVLGFTAAALGVVAAAEWAVILPVAGIVAGVALIIAALAALAYVIYTNWDSIKEYTLKVWDAIVGALTAAWDWIVGIFRKVWDVIGPIVTAGWEIISSYFKAAWETIKTILTTAWEVIKTIFSTAFLAIYYLVTGQWDKIGTLFKSAGEKLKSILSNAWEKIKSIWTNAFEAIKNSASRGWEAIKDVFTGTWNSIRDFFAGIPKKLEKMGQDMIQGLINGIKSMASSVVNAVSDTVSGAVDAAKNFLGINSPSKVFMEIGGFTGEGFALGIDRTINDVAGAVKDMAGMSVDVIHDRAGSNERDSGGEVYNLDGMFSGATFNVRSDNDIKLIAKELYTLQRTAMRGRGLIE